MVRVHLSPFNLEELNISLNGGVAQLGEHLPCKQGVMSSNLTISIRFFGTVILYLENCILIKMIITEMLFVRHPRKNCKQPEVVTLGDGR